MPDHPALSLDWQSTAFSGLAPEAQALLERSIGWALPRMRDMTGGAGEPTVEHAAALVGILAGMHTDGATRAAAFVAGALLGEEAAPRSRADPLAQAVGAEVARLARGYRAVLRVGQAARESGHHAGDEPQVEKLRKMMLAMAVDIRIVLMRLASRLQTLRWHAAHKQPPERALAVETLDLYAPLANRLGVWQIKWELEDLAFRFLEPIRYKEIASLLEDKRAGREALIGEVTERLRSALREQGIEAEVFGRPKHIYSIWNKMRTKHLAFSDLYDVHAMRVIVADERTCYAVLSLVHELFAPVTQEFDDYIARPKPNGYRSLHAVVRDGQGRPFEVQIRTRDMHAFAEYGVAAHWRYKEAGAKGGQARADSEYDRRLAFMRQLLAWGSEQAAQAGEVPATGAAPKVEDDRIYVLTPQARVVELPAKATPVDFAYHVHTDLGHRCRGAKVDGAMVPLHTQLKTGQTVEIISAKSGGPSRDWLNPQLGYLASSRSRAKVRQWFNAIEMQQRTAQGQAMLEKELQRRGKTAVNLEQLAQQLGFACADDLHIALAKDEFSLRALDQVFHEGAAELEADEVVARQARPDSTERSGKSGVLVVGVDSLLTQLARCCRPAPPDAIGGFVTRGRGVSVHRADCPSFAELSRRHPERVIEVSWGETGETVYPVDVQVTAQDRAGLLRDLSEVFARMRLNVVGVNTISRQGTARMAFTLEINNGQQLSRALTALSEVPGVESAARR
nr:bifunctional (p)ppGpp synthetase/guanosine-3',5'-bis(diphosphate) 3'-pyrophosphohydrolase [Verticiella sediminum]